MLIARDHEVKRLCWMQRIALIRHSLHSASRNSDFTFFKNLQAQAFLDGTDHVAILGSLLGQDTDAVLHALDDLNAGLAYIHQDAFKSVYDNIRNSIGEEEHCRRGKLHVDTSQQKQIADFSIDKMTNTAIAFIESQEPHCQEAVAAVWLFGATLIADAIETTMIQMNKLESIMDDFILLEYGWLSVQTSVEATVSALRGVFNLMASTQSGLSLLQDRNISGISGHSRTGSTSSTTGSLFRRLSLVLTHPVQASSSGGAPAAPPSSARNNICNAESPQQLRTSISQTFPVAVPMGKLEYQRRLSTIPPTPFENNINPFDEANFRSSQANSSYAIDNDRSESPSPLDVDALAMHVEPQAGVCTNNGTAFFPRLSHELSTRAFVI